MKSIRRGALVTCAVVAGTWGLIATPASADGEPTTTPTMVAPVDATSVAGDVPISASSTADLVQFYVDASPFGSPVAVTAGTASATWSTWGLANTGPFVWTAADCNISGCNATQSPGVSVSILNDVPALTAPLEGDTTNNFPTFTATAPGGALAFVLDGVQIGVDTTAPFSQSVAGPLADGAHSVVVKECDVTGATCDGPTATVNFTVATPVLHPQITAVSPNPFSPRVDGRNDLTAFRIHLPDAETVSFSVRNGSGQTVNGPHSAGNLAAGDHIYRWNGKNNAGRIAGDGVYTIAVATSAVRSGVTEHGTATASVRLDDTGSLLHGAGGSGATFYPVVDHYLDAFGPKMTVNEGGTLWLQIYTLHGALLAQIAKPHAAAGTVQINWNGRNHLNQIVAEGAYHFRFLAQDLAGNRDASPLAVVHVSHRKLVNKSVTVTRPGNAGAIFTSDRDCTGYSFAQSRFAHGVWLVNTCDPDTLGFQAIFGEYDFLLPAAARYNTIRVQSLGNTVSAPEPLVAVIYNAKLATYAGVGESSITRNNVNLTNVYGTVAAPSFVSATRHVRLDIVVPDSAPPEDYDIGSVSIVLSYSVLS